MIDRSLPPSISDFNSLSMPALEKEKLPSGVTLHYLDNKLMDIVDIAVVFDSGTLESDNIAAGALALPLTGEGSINHPDGQLSELLEYNGVTTSVKMHDHHSEFHFCVLKSRFKDVMPLIREYIYTPAFDARPIDIYKENAAQGYLISRERVNFHSERIMSEHIFGHDHPKARVITDDEFMAITRSDIISAYSGMLCSPVSVYVAGSIDDGLRSMIDGIFAGVGASADLPCRIIPYSGYGLGERYNWAMPGKLQSSVNISLPVIGREHSDYIMLRNLVIALGGYFGGRLMSNIREEKGLTYGISAALYGTPEGAYIAVNSMTANANVDAVVEETIKEIDRLSVETIGDEEFATVRSYILSRLASQLDTPLNILQHNLSLKSAFIPHEDYFERQFATAISMTPDSLREVARRHLMGRQWTVAVAGDI